MTTTPLQVSNDAFGQSIKVGDTVLYATKPTGGYGLIYVVGQVVDFRVSPAYPGCTEIQASVRPVKVAPASETRTKDSWVLCVNVVKYHP